MFKMKTLAAMSIVGGVSISCAHYRELKTEVVRNVAAEKGNETGNPIVLSMPCKDRVEQVDKESWPQKEKEIKDMGVKLITDFYKKNQLSNIESINISKVKFDRKLNTNSYKKEYLEKYYAYFIYTVEAGADSAELELSFENPLRDAGAYYQRPYTKTDALGRVTERGFECSFVFLKSYGKISVRNPATRTLIVFPTDFRYPDESLRDYVVKEN